LKPIDNVEHAPATIAIISRIVSYSRMDLYLHAPSLSAYSQFQKSLSMNEVKQQEWFSVNQREAALGIGLQQLAKNTWS